MIPGHKRKDCEKLQPLLDDYLHGELPRATADRLAAHLDACGDCRGALDDLRISATLVGAAFEQTEDPSPGFVRLVMARINVAEQWLQEQRSFWRPIEALSLRLVFSAALVLAFLFAYEFRTPPVVTSAAPSAVLVPQADAFARPASFSPTNSDEVLMAIAERRHEQQ
ncbi:MAG: zf-HC2 domain-containing protein [Candidatus Acidiferrales bacterium]